ncbi:MAG: FAD-binding protein [Thermodesulfobacteriota bacterium]
MTKVIETDVLVIGSGLAGTMAALAATENGADVLITSKANLPAG